MFDLCYGHIMPDDSLESRMSQFDCHSVTKRFQKYLINKRLSKNIYVYIYINVLNGFNKSISVKFVLVIVIISLIYE